MNCPIELCLMGIVKKVYWICSTIRGKCNMRKYRGFAYSQILEMCESFDSQRDVPKAL